MAVAKMARRLGRTKGVKIDGLDDSGLDSELDDEQKIANYYNVELERNKLEEVKEKTQSEKELLEE